MAQPQPCFAEVPPALPSAHHFGARAAAAAAAPAGPKGRVGTGPWPHGPWSTAECCGAPARSGRDFMVVWQTDVYASKWLQHIKQLYFHPSPCWVAKVGWWITGITNLHQGTGSGCAKPGPCACGSSWGTPNWMIGSDGVKSALKLATENGNKSYSFHETQISAEHTPAWEPRERAKKMAGHRSRRASHRMRNAKGTAFHVKTCQDDFVRPESPSAERLGKQR